MMKTVNDNGMNFERKSKEKIKLNQFETVNIFIENKKE